MMPPSVRAALIAHRMRLKDELVEIDDVLKADTLEPSALASLVKLRPKPDRRKKKRRMSEETKQKIRTARLKQIRANKKKQTGD